MGELQKEGALPLCLRCAETRLDLLPESSVEVAFYACPTCYRHYAQRSGSGLTFRWRHPISLALYDFSYHSSGEADIAVRIASDLADGMTAEQLVAFVQEIEDELSTKTQQVRDILQSPQSEEACRMHLSSVVRRMRSTIRRED